MDVRLICSSSKDLKDEIRIGNFREDLFHRINVFEINIEPLNQRISDILQNSKGGDDLGIKYGIKIPETESLQILIQKSIKI